MIASNMPTWTQTISYVGHRPHLVTRSPGDVAAYPAWTVEHDGADRLVDVASTGYTFHATFEPTNPARASNISENIPGDISATFDVGYSVAPDPTSGPSTSDPAAVSTIGMDGETAISQGYDLSGSLQSRNVFGTAESYHVDPYGHLWSMDGSAGTDYYIYDASGGLTHAYSASSNTLVATIPGLADIRYRRVGATTFVRFSVERLLGGGAVPVARVTDNDRPVGFVHRDAFGNVSLVRNWNGSSTAPFYVDSRYDYTPYGWDLGSSRGETSRDIRRYGGGVTSTGGGRTGGNLVLFGARHYDPMSRRWISRDPLSRGASGNDPYEFAGSSPLLFADPTGLNMEALTGSVDDGGHHYDWAYSPDGGTLTFTLNDPRNLEPQYSPAESLFVSFVDYADELSQSDRFAPFTYVPQGLALGAHAAEAIIGRDLHGNDLDAWGTVMHAAPLVTAGVFHGIGVARGMTTTPMVVESEEPRLATVSEGTGRTNTQTRSTTRYGYTRDNPGDWRDLRDAWDGATNLNGEHDMRGILSDSNRDLIEAGHNPVVDAEWINYFPGDAPLRGQAITIHHVQGNNIRVPLPTSRHLDSHMPGGYRYNPGGPGTSG